MRVIILAYNVKTNGIIERGHKPVIDVLVKITKDGIGKWVRNLYTIF
jgi:hypothetical protein